MIFKPFFGGFDIMGGCRVLLEYKIFITEHLQEMGRRSGVPACKPLMTKISAGPKSHQINSLKNAWLIELTYLISPYDSSTQQELVHNTFFDQVNYLPLKSKKISHVLLYYLKHLFVKTFQNLIAQIKLCSKANPLFNTQSPLQLITIIINPIFVE